MEKDDPQAVAQACNRSRKGVRVSITDWFGTEWTFLDGYVIEMKRRQDERSIQRSPRRMDEPPEEQGDGGADESGQPESSA